MQVAQAGSATVPLAAAPIPELETVVVTASRRANDIQKTPAAITAVSSAALDASFINEISGLNAVVPSLEITHASGFENLVTIRGVGSGTPENAPTTVPGVAEFVDGVYIANTISLDQTLFDIDHIEVLRGPQGALYGQSADGGAITILTKQPKLGVYDASGDFSAGDYALFRERLETNIPIGDTVAVRISAQAYDHDGFTVNEALPNTRLDDAHDMSGKVAVLWKPNETFSATITGQVYHADENGAAQKNILDPSSDPRVVYQDYPSHFDLTTQLYHVNLEWDLPWFIAKSVTAYQQLDHVQQEDSSRSAFSILHYYDDVAGWNTHLQNYNEEFDLLSKPGSRLEWTVGAFVLNQRSTQFVVEYYGDTANPSTSIPANVETNPPSNLEFGQLEDVNRQSYSGFGQATYHLLPGLRITAGARVNHDTYTAATYGFSAPAFGGPTDGPSHTSSSYSDTVPTWRAEADYDLTPQNMIYASVARGYKPGGVNANTTAVVVPGTYKPETNTAYEVGSRSQFLERTITLNLTAFYYDYKNMEYIEYDPVPYQYGIAGIPSIHMYGVEAEGGYTSPDHRFKLSGDLALENGFAEGNYKTIDSTVANSVEGSASACQYGGAYYNPACWSAVESQAVNIQGKHPPAMPKISGSVAASYAFDIPFGTLTPRVQYIYRGSEWARIFNDPQLDKVGAYGVTNFNLDFVPINSRFKFSLTATNAFNVAGVNSRYTDPYGTSQTSQQYIAPRQIIGTVAVAF